MVAEALTAWELGLDVRAVEACTSELVTDALRHGRSPLHLVVQDWTDWVQVMVINGAESHEASEEAADYDESSVRRRVVGGLATSWGTETLPAGTATWFDLETKAVSSQNAYRW